MNDVREHMDEAELDRFEARYFNNLSESEVRAFDDDLKRDPEFSKRYRAFQLTLKGILSSRRTSENLDPSAIKEHLQQVDRELDGIARGQVRYWLAAAAVIFLTFGIWWLQRPPEHVRLAKDYFFDEPGLPVLMNADQRNLDPVMNDLKLGRYKEASDALQAMLANEPSNDTLHYFAGITALELEHFDPAIEHFQLVPENSVFGNKAMYQMAICHLNNGDLDNTKILLERVVQSGDDQLSDRARELLSHL